MKVLSSELGGHIYSKISLLDICTSYLLNYRAVLTESLTNISFLHDIDISLEVDSQMFI